MNMKFCKVVGDGAEVEYAPHGWTDCVCPTEADYLARGWLKNAIVPPSPNDGWMVASTRYEAQGDAVYAVYTYAPMPKPVTRYSKLKIYGAIAQLGVWSQVEAWLKAKEIGGVNGWMAFQLAQEVADDHPLFAPLADEAKMLLGLTDEQFAALLANCVLEG